MVSEVSKLKQQLGGDIIVPASVQLIRPLLEHDSVDELRLKIFPVVLGAGVRPPGDQRQETHAALRHPDH